MNKSKRLPRNVVLLSWVSFVTDIASEMAYPLLPLFIVGVLHAPATALGGIEGVATAIIAILTAITGWRSDRIRKRVVFIRWGYGLPILGKALVAASIVWPMVLVGRVIDRVGKGLRTSPRDALIAEAVDADQRGRAFGFHRAFDSAGALIGVLIAAGVLFFFASSDTDKVDSSTATTIRWLLGISAAIGLGSLSLTFLIKDTTREESINKSTSQSQSQKKFGRGYWLALAMLVVFAIANSSDAFLLLRAADVGLSPFAVVLAYALFNLTYTVLSYPAGILSDRFGRWRMIAAGWIIYALVYAGFAVTGSVGVWPLMALYGCFMALTDGVGKAIIADQAPPERHATAMGILHLSLGFSALSSSLIAGILWDTIGPAAPFWFGAAAASAAVLMLIIVRPMLSQSRDD